MQFIVPALFLAVVLFLLIIMLSVISLDVIPSEFETKEKKRDKR
jgi:hypothetical protein